MPFPIQIWTTFEVESRRSSCRVRGPGRSTWGVIWSMWQPVEIGHMEPKKAWCKNMFLQKYTSFRGQVFGVEVCFTNNFFSVEAQQVIFQHNCSFPEIHHSLMCHVLSTNHRNLPPKPWEADPCGRQSTNGTRNSSPKSKRERENHLPNSQFFGGVPVFTHG